LSLAAGHTEVDLLCSGTVTTGMENSLKNENCSVILTEQRRRITLVSNYSCTLRGKEKERFLKKRNFEIGKKKLKSPQHFSKHFVFFSRLNNFYFSCSVILC
jgi:hypothetical protein